MYNYSKLSILILSTVILLTGCIDNSTTNSRNITYQQKILGSWKCIGTEVAEDDTTINYDFTTTYVRDNTSYALGNFNFKDKETDESFEFTFNSSCTWKIKDNYLIETGCKAKMLNISHPLINTIIDFDKILPERFSESSKIISLNNSDLITLSDSDNTLLKCSKVITSNAR